MTILSVECTPDECIARVLGVSKKQIIHHNDKGRIGNLIKTTHGIKAMVDEDPGTIPSASFRTLKSSGKQYGVRMLSDAKKKHEIIVLCPRLEGWILDAAKKTKVSLDDFGLPTSEGALHREISRKLKSFERLLEHLLKNKNPNILHLQALLKKLTK